VAGRKFARARRVVLFVSASLVAGLAWDLTRPPASAWSNRTAISAIHLYQRVASPLLSSAGVHCRFYPTCSRYAEQALERHGLLKGGWMAAKRIARCGPWTPVGTVDLPQ
jgi:uncharacterized protein